MSTLFRRRRLIRCWPASDGACSPKSRAILADRSRLASLFPRNINCASVVLLRERCQMSGVSSIVDLSQLAKSRNCSSRFVVSGISSAQQRLYLTNHFICRSADLDPELYDQYQAFCYLGSHRGHREAQMHRSQLSPVILCNYYQKHP